MPDKGNPVISALRAIIPAPLRPKAREIFRNTRWKLRTSAPWRAVRRWIARGDRVTCPCCERSFDRFLEFRRRANAECPNCFSLERHRLLWLYLRDQRDLLTEPTRLLHFAPELWLSRTLSRRPNIRYASVDKYAGGVMAKADMTALPFRDEAFDVILEVHVIQNIEDDVSALRELRRVMRTGGWAILQENLDYGRATTVEDPSALGSSLARERAFGFHEFARRYGRDFPSRVAPYGFEPQVIDLPGQLGPDAMRRFGLHKEPVYRFTAVPVNDTAGGGATRDVARAGDSRTG